MYDFASRITLGEKFPSLALSLEPLDPAIFVHHSPVPKGVESTVV